MLKPSFVVLKRGAKEVLEEGLSYRKAAENFGVDKMTLMRFIKKGDLTCAVEIQSTILNNQVLTHANLLLKIKCQFQNHGKEIVRQ